MSRTEYAIEAAARLWKRPASEVFGDDISESYGWPKAYAIVLVRSVDFQTMLAASAENKEPVLFEGRADPKHNLAAINGLLRAEGVSLPDGIPLARFCLTMRHFLSGPGGFVASDAFFKEQEASIYLWTSRTPEGTVDLFRQWCREPVLTRRNKDWTLQFFYFNNRGGVEQWDSSGDAQSIQGASCRSVVADKTFDFPYV
jgi:hypothetical protein